MPRGAKPGATVSVEGDEEVDMGKPDIEARWAVVACLLDGVVPGPRCRSVAAGRLAPAGAEEAAEAAAEAAAAAAAAALADGAVLGT